MKRIFGAELSSIVNSYQTLSPIRGIQAMPYTELPNKTNRHFIATSQLLNSIKQLDTNSFLGGCILYNNSIICTYLDNLVTRCILHNVQYLEQTQKHVQQNLASHHDFSEIETNMLSVFVSQGQIKNHKSLHHSPINLAEEGEFAGLYILTIEKLSLAILMTLSSLEDTQHIKRIRLAADLKLSKLAATLQKSFLESGVSPQKPLARTSYHFEDGTSNSYHFLMFDTSTEMSTGTPSMDSKFSSHVNNARNTLCEDPVISQVLLRDQSSGIYCRRTFGKEIYFQPSSSNPHHLFMDHIERTVQNSLKKDHNLNVF